MDFKHTHSLLCGLLENRLTEVGGPGDPVWRTLATCIVRNGQDFVNAQDFAAPVPEPTTQGKSHRLFCVSGEEMALELRMLIARDSENEFAHLVA